MTHISNNDYEFKFTIPKYKLNFANPIIENYRFVKYSELKQSFVDFFIKKDMLDIPIDKQIKKFENMFSRYIILQISNNNNNNDPLIPHEFPKDHDIQLKQNLIYANPLLNIKQINDSLDEFNISQKCKKLNTSIVQYYEKMQNVPYKIIENENNDVITFKCQAKMEELMEINLTKIVYNKMKLLYMKKLSLIKNILYDEQLFLTRLYCLLLRYITISVEREPSLLNSFFNDMYDTLNINFELMASSVNTSCDYYCSLFYDVEQYFGYCCGNMFNMELIKGSYELNLVLDEKIMNNASDLIIKWLKNSKKSLRLIVFITAWDSTSRKEKFKDNKEKTKFGEFYGYKNLINSGFVVFSLKNVVEKKIQYINYHTNKNIIITHGSPHILILQNKYAETINENLLNNMFNKYVKKL